MAATTRTFTATIEDITSVSSGVWRITLANNQAVLSNNPFDFIAYDNIGDTNVLLNPFINAQNIDYHPYNALLNNASTLSNTGLLQKVDYSGGSTVPINLEQLRNSTADKAEVNEYIHNSAGYISGRYQGKQLVGQTVNEYIVGDKSYGTTPVIEHTSKYFAYGPSAERVDPLMVNKTQYSLKYLVDENENVIDLTAVANAGYFTERNFTEGSVASIKLQDPLYNGNNSYLNGDYQIVSSGKRPELILTTETSLGSFTATSITFGGSATPNYQFIANKTSDQLISPTAANVTFTNEVSDGSGYYATGTSTYTFGSDSQATLIFITRGSVENIKTQAIDLTIEIQLDGTPIQTAVLTVPPGNNFNFYVSSPSRFFTSGQAVRVRAYADIGLSIKSGAEFYANQSPLPNSSVNTAGIWTTGSANNLWLTSSNTLAAIWDVGIQDSLPASTFPSASLPFTVEVGDEIRFDGTESRTFKVVDVNKTGKVYIKLDNPVSKQINIEHFTLRRLVDDPSSIIVSQKKTPGAISPVFVIPKYTTEELQQNLETIITNLKVKNLI